MKPREQLEKEISITIRESFHKGFDSESVSELDNFDGFAEAEEALSHYAIGRWVPVSERLPEFKNEYWSGYMIEDGRIINDIRSEVWFITGNATHWLELDIPEVEQ